MNRRITRTLIQGSAFLLLLLVVVFVADTRYRVLPAALHTHLPSHHAGSVVTDVALAVCSAANPFSACRLDPDKWHRVEKDLYLHSGWFSSAWLHVQRKREEELADDDMVVLGVKVGRLDPGLGESGRNGEHWEARPGGIWVLRGKGRKESDSSQAVTAVDVLFGADAVDPRPGWELASSALLVDADSKMHLPRLSIRRGQPKTPDPNKTPIPRIRKDGRFKILQVSDAHLATGIGTCRDAIGSGNAPSKDCDADLRTLSFVERILDDEKPDLVVLSGDQVEGPAAPDTQSAIFKFAAPLIERGIPYAAIFGNHDDEGPRSLSRAAQMSLLQALPSSLSQPGPDDLPGVGNYYLEVLAPGSSEHSALTLYLLDSHSLTPDEKHYHGYDWLKEPQIAWFRRTAQSLRRSPPHAKYSHIHLDMAFIHIPLPELRDTANILAGGDWREGVTAPNYNSHFYDALAQEGVVALGVGHDHVNDYCAIQPPSAEGKLHGPWMCYAGGSGFGGYAGYGGFHRRVRVWEADTNAGRMRTWKRVECCTEEEMARKVDELLIVEGGRVVAPEQGR